jgi:hypothetical protein
MASGLTRWEPFAELGELRSRLDRIFGDVVEGRQRPWTPAIDVIRDNGNLVVRADVPGIKSDEVKIEVEDDIITVSGQHEEQKEEKDKHYLRKERRYGSFSLDGAAAGRRSEGDHGHSQGRRRRGDDPAAGSAGKAEDRDQAGCRVISSA